MASSANLREAASAVSRASALSSQACAGARSASGSVVSVPVANGDVEQDRRHHMAQRLVVHLRGVGDLLALLREFGTFGLGGTLELREAVVESGKIGRGSARRRFRVVQGARGLVGLRA